MALLCARYASNETVENLDISLGGTAETTSQLQSFTIGDVDVAKQISRVYEELLRSQKEIGPLRHGRRFTHNPLGSVRVNDGQDLLDSIRLYLPKYLTPEQARDLWSGLADFPKNIDYYWFDSGLSDEILQGDGWRGLVVRDFFTGDRRTVSGVVLSNSCDVALENETNTPAHIVFAPLISVSKFEDSAARAWKDAPTGGVAPC